MGPCGPELRGAAIPEIVGYKLPAGWAMGLNTGGICVEVGLRRIKTHTQRKPTTDILAHGRRLRRRSK